MSRVTGKLILNPGKCFQVAPELATKSGWSTELPKILLSNVGELAADKILKALNAISSRLNAVFKLKPLTNKIIAKIKVISTETKLTDSNVQNLTDVSKTGWHYLYTIHIIMLYYFIKLIFGVIKTNHCNVGIRYVRRST